jgi:ABC transporter
MLMSLNRNRLWRVSIVGIAAGGVGAALAVAGLGFWGFVVAAALSTALLGFVVDLPPAEQPNKRSNAWEAAHPHGPLLNTEHVTKVFDGLVAVEDITFQIPERSIVSIIGPKGAGKTTFFNMLTGLHRPTYGRIYFEGRDVTGRRPDLIRKDGVAQTFQNISLIGTMTALENVMIGQNTRMRPGLLGSILRTPWVRREQRAGEQKARETLSYVGIPESQHEQLPVTFPMGTSAGSRSPRRWRPIPSCCCLMSPPPA